MGEENNLEHIVEKEEKSFFKRTRQRLLSLADKSKGFIIEHNNLSSIVAGTALFSTFYLGTHIPVTYIVYLADLHIGETTASFKDYLLSHPFMDYDKSALAIATTASILLPFSIINPMLAAKKHLRKLGLKVNRGTVYDVKRKKTLKGIIRWPLDFILERPLIPAVGTFMYYATESYFRYSELLTKNPSVPPTLFAALCALDIFEGMKAGVITFLLSCFLHSRSRFGIGLLGFFLSKFNKNLAIKIYDFDKSSNALRSLKAKILLDKGNLEDAMEEYELAVRQTGENTLGPYNIRLFTFGVPDAVRLIKRNPQNIHAYTYLSNTLFELNYQEKSVEVLDDMLKNNPGMPELYCYVAGFCGMINRHEDAQGYLRRAIDAFLSSPDSELRFEQIPGSRNEVLLIKSKYLGKEFVFKRSQQAERMRRESVVTAVTNAVLNEYLLQHGLGREFSTVEQSVSFLEHNTQFYHVKKRVLAATLDKKQPDVREVSIALSSLAKLHGLVSPHVSSENGTHYIIHRNGAEQRELLPVFDFKEEVERRFVSRLGHHESEKELLAQISGFADYELKGMPSNFLLHGDFYDTNVLEGGILIDLERASIGSPLVDLASFFGNPRYASMNKMQLFDFYSSQLKSFSGASLSAADIKQVYSQVELLMNLCQIGSKINQGNLDMALRYFTQVVSGLKDFKSLNAAFQSYISNAPNGRILTGAAH